ncbi:MAG: hypothetical protein AAFZ07_29765, partial [Actinomycetota bacterium]
LDAFDPAYATELGRKAEFLGAEDVARLVVALDDGDVGGVRPELVDRLWRSVIFQLRGGAEVYAGLQEKGLGNPLILPSETRTLASMTRALNRRAPSDRRFEPLVDALVRLGRGDGWGSTQADASALLALGRHIRSWLEELAQSDLAADPESDAGCVVRQLKRRRDKLARLPQDLVEETARTASASHHAWA